MEEPLLVKRVIYGYYDISGDIAQPALLKMVFVARRGKTRQIVNESDMLQAINNTCGTLVRLEKHFFERKSFYWQLKLMSETDIIIGVHGAAFVNIMFMMPFSGFIEFKSPAARLMYYTMMARRTQLIYREMWKAKVDFSGKLPRDKRNCNLIADIKEVVDSVREIAQNVKKEKYRIV